MARRIDTYLRDLLSDDKYDFYSVVRDFADQEIAPNILEWERNKQLVPDECIAQMGDIGLFGLPIEEEYGGQGGDQTDLILMGLALGYHSQSVAITPGAAASLGAKPLQLCGTEEQKRAHLPDLAAGKRMFAFGLSEPGRGSDAANPELTARRDGDNWVLNGEKCWCTNAKWASHVVVHAMSTPDGPPGRRSTCFIVPMDDDSVFYQEMAGKRVWEQSSTGSIVLENTIVPHSAVLGDNGFKVMVTTLNGGRLFIAGLALASLAFALDKCRIYAEERIQFDNQPIGRFQRIQDVIVDMDIALERNLTWLLHLCKMFGRGQNDSRASREDQSRLEPGRQRPPRAGHGDVWRRRMLGRVRALPTSH